MKILKKEEMNKIFDIFKGNNETLIWSCLQGYMGSAWVDNTCNPKSVQIIVGDFCFFAGAANMELVRSIPSNFQSECILMIPQSEKWCELIEDVYKNNYDKFMRYATKKDVNSFNKENLNGYIKSIPKEYKIVKIDKKIYDMVKEEKWSKDLCSQFSNYNEYEKNGIGFVVMHGLSIVSGASSYTVYNKGIEIEIDTKEEYRRRGLALACASKLILKCLEKEIYPSWDAANKSSLNLSEKLGYHFDKEYITYAIKIWIFYIVKKCNLI